MLGAKELLPGRPTLRCRPLPFIATRAYGNCRTKTPAPSGLLKPGWKVAADIMRLRVRRALMPTTAEGRAFTGTVAGAIHTSRSESFWLARCGVLMPDKATPAAPDWQARKRYDLSPNTRTARTARGPWWVLGWPEGAGCRMRAFARAALPPATVC
ncbi:hypothetical protein KCP73_01445 [Salmonella enterica subsp. enterica]|nr:hypothetical protein KCP73_01445 [Salmonella enterica subsp. enterica]